MRSETSRYARWQAAQSKEASYWSRDEVMASQLERVRTRYGPVLKSISGSLGRDARILDLGCGPTCAAQLVPTGVKTYLDPLMNDYMHHYAASLPDGAKVCSMAESLPAPSDSFDVVVSVNALDHMCRPEDVIAEVHRVLRDDGLFILGIFLHSPPIALARRFIERCLPFAREDAHPYSYTRAGIRSLVQRWFTIDREVTVCQESTAGIELLHREDRLFLCTPKTERKD
jgi:SAM-dependent methyltransferase